jgi:hypothetical protein
MDRDPLSSTHGLFELAINGATTAATASPSNRQITQQFSMRVPPVTVATWTPDIAKRNANRRVLFCHAVGLLAAWVAKARPAGADALTFPMTAGSTPTHTGIAVSRGRECGHSPLVTPRRGGLRARQAHGSAALRCQGGTWQERRDNDAQDKTHDASPFFGFHVNAPGHVLDADQWGRPQGKRQPQKRTRLVDTRQPTRREIRHAQKGSYSKTHSIGCLGCNRGGYCCGRVFAGFVIVFPGRRFRSLRLHRQDF